MWLYYDPEKAWWLKPEERQYILKNRVLTEDKEILTKPVKKMTVGMLLKQKPCGGYY